MASLAEMLRQGADKLINLPSEAQRFVTNPQAFTQLLTGKNPLPRETGFAAGATGLPPTEMSVLDPNQAPYMQGYSQGEPIGYAGMAAPFAAPAAVATAKALAPKAGMMAENYMARQGMMPSIVPQGTDNAITSVDRMAIAQRNAALPVSEGGLGLPANNTAAQRAEAMGFDMAMFHGTDTPIIESFDPQMTKIIKGIFSSNNPKTASKYAEEAGLKKRAKAMGMESSPNVLPLLIKSESHKRIPKFDVKTINDFRNNENKGVYRDEMGVAVTFDPTQIRSRFAAFDPKQINSPNILAGGLAIPIIDEDNRKAMLEKLFNSQ
jgi:hypothetical protein